VITEYGITLARDPENGLGLVLEHEGEGDFEITVGALQPGSVAATAAGAGGEKIEVDDVLTHVAGEAIYGKPFDDVIGLLRSEELVLRFSREPPAVAAAAAAAAAAADSGSGGGGSAAPGTPRSIIMRRGSNIGMLLAEGGALEGVTAMPASPTLKLPETKGMRMNGRLFKKGGGTGMTGRRNWKERYFVMALKGGGASTLKYYRPNGDNKRLGSVMLRDYAEVVEAAGDTGDTVKEKHQFRFNLVPREDSGADEKNRWLQLRAKSESEMREWIESLNTAIRLSDDEEGEEDQDDS